MVLIVLIAITRRKSTNFFRHGRKRFLYVNYFVYFCKSKTIQSDMESVATVERPKAVRTAHSSRGRKPIGTIQSVDKTPESELMEVDEYFEILRKRVNDYYDSLQGQD